MTLTAVTATTSAIGDLNQYRNHLQGAVGSTEAWHLRVATGENFQVTLADSGGVQDFRWNDSGGTRVAGVDSDGNADFAGTLGVTGATTLSSTLGVTGAVTVTSAAAAALAVGANGNTNPVLRVVASTASVATGISITGAAAAGRVAIAVLSSGANEGLDVDALGSGTIRIGNTSTGAITLARATTVSAGDFTVSAGDIIMGQAISQIVPGATSLSLRNNADSADNLIITDAGAATFRSTVGGITKLALNGATVGAQNSIFRAAQNQSFTGEGFWAYVDGNLTKTDATGSIAASIRAGGGFVLAALAGNWAGRFADISVDGSTATLNSQTLADHNSLYLGTPVGGTTVRIIDTAVAGCFASTAGVWTDASHEFAPDGRPWKIRRGLLRDAVDPLALLDRINVHAYDLTDEEFEDSSALDEDGRPRRWHVAEHDRAGHIGVFSEELAAVSPLLARPEDGGGVSPLALAAFSLAALQALRAEVARLVAAVGLAP